MVLFFRQVAIPNIRNHNRRLPTGMLRGIWVLSRCFPRLYRSVLLFGYFVWQSNTFLAEHHTCTWPNVFLSTSLGGCHSYIRMLSA